MVKTLNDANEVERQRLTSLINSMTDGVIAVDENTEVVLYNGGALNILNINQTITNLPIEKVLKLVDEKNKSINVKRLISSTKIPTTSRNFRIPYKDGSFANLYLSIAPVRQGYGKTDSGGYVLIIRDITKEKSLEEERDEFISVISHELRTPIAIAEGNVSNAILLIDKSDNIEPVKQALDQTYTQINFLGGLINDLSTLARAERGTLDLAIEPINVVNLINGLVEGYTASATEKHLKLEAECSEELEMLYSSELYVREILQNFITNAIKYTDSGTVSITAKPSGNGVSFAVTDSGIGISKSDQEKVFDKFFRSEDFETRKNSGTGLGLYVTAKLSKLIKASISLSSELGVGSTFTINIPNLKETKTKKS